MEAHGGAERARSSLAEGGRRQLVDNLDDNLDDNSENVAGVAL